MAQLGLFYHLINFMKSTLYIIVFLIACITFQANAQLVIGTNNPDQQAIADMTASDKGVLIPRVALSATNNISPFAATPATSMLVYNTATAGDVTPGFYYYSGTAWVRLVNPADVSNSSSTFGTSPNYIQYEDAAGYFKYYGTNTIWDDLRIQVTTRTGGSAPTFASGFGGGCQSLDI